MKSLLFLFLMSVLVRPVAAQIKPDTSRQGLLAAAREVMLNSKKCALITQDEQERPQVRTMDPFTPDPDFTVWLATRPNTRKASQIMNNPKVTLYYPDKDDNGYVTIHGIAELIHDQKEKDKRWKEEWKNFYLNRTDQYLLIKITPEYMEVINYKAGISGDPRTWQPAKVIFK